MHVERSNVHKKNEPMKRIRQIRLCSRHQYIILADQPYPYHLNCGFPLSPLSPESTPFGSGAIYPVRTQSGASLSLQAAPSGYLDHLYKFARALQIRGPFCPANAAILSLSSCYDIHLFRSLSVCVCCYNRFIANFEMLNICNINSENQ